MEKTPLRWLKNGEFSVFIAFWRKSTQPRPPVGKETHCNQILTAFWAGVDLDDAPIRHFPMVEQLQRESLTFPQAFFLPVCPTFSPPQAPL